ncbi:MBL fold hydrolase [Arachidicoccus ginsenosidimutans]|uniref:MBL fold metallo-hydrolase n=1 Tax=Arachidicoccus sp. BS20 TaxID=1850526 RepID=UPI0007F0F29C|nr:MBL fold metallo-hydrolase [Arachidicoccus sp. BS20]ANI88760.1 MBL fold hydrolase [Arachidicoccus sp. BS20]
MLKIQIFTFNPFQENTYVLRNDKGEAIIIDAGAYFPAEVQTLYDYILRAGLQPKFLLNTHCHLDHIFGIEAIGKKYNLELFIHPLEEEIIAKAKESGEKFGLNVEDFTAKINFVNEGETITLGNDELRVILAPGHSPGSICFYNEEQNFLIGGDVLFRESIGRTDLYKGSHEQLLHSIKEKLFILPDETVVYPGHGTATTIGYEKLHNPFLQ